MNTQSHLPFLMQMRAVAREARSRGRRCHYTPDQRDQAIAFLSDVLGAGGTLEDAAEMMSVFRQTLENWLEQWTRPTTEPPPGASRVVNVTIQM